MLTNPIFRCTPLEGLLIPSVDGPEAPVVRDGKQTNDQTDTLRGLLAVERDAIVYGWPYLWH